MATKVLKKSNQQMAMAKTFSELHPISQNKIFQKARTFSADGIGVNGNEIFTLLAPIKPLITVRLDPYGNVTPSEIVLGNQWDHRSTWLHFDLSDLLWGDRTSPYNPQDFQGYEEAYYYAQYDFKLFFKSLTSKTTQSWDFDGIDFQIPEEITKTSGKYEITIVIQEKLGDNAEGNIPDREDGTERETFISHSFVGMVTPNVFDPSLLEGISIVEENTTQRRSLVKPAIDCFLTDDGYFDLVDYQHGSDLGILNDAYMKYLRFNPRNLTAHLDKFRLFVIFNNAAENLNEISIFERTNPQDQWDDYRQPVIAWVPSKVLNKAGKWNMYIVAQSRKDISMADNFYRLISTSLLVNVTPGNVTIEELADPVDDSFFDSNFITKDNQAIISQDNAILRSDVNYGNKVSK